MKKIISVLLIAAAILIAGVIVWYSKEPGVTFQPAPVMRVEQVAVVVKETDPFKGNRSAPVTLVMIGSFTCPACKSQARVMDTVLALYPDSLKIVWKDLPEDSGVSYEAAVAARCAQRQGRFWDYHDRLFIKQGGLGAGKLFLDWASDLGLRKTEFEACMADKNVRYMIDVSIDELLAAGVEQVPHFLLNDTVAFAGPVELPVFREAIDAILQR